LFVPHYALPISYPAPAPCVSFIGYLLEKQKLDTPLPLVSRRPVRLRIPFLSRPRDAMARQFVLKADDNVPARQRLTIDYAGELNPQQYAAATAPGGPVLVIAGAGTGKTRTLVYRVAYLVETGTPPENIVLLTFTRRAAQE